MALGQVLSHLHMLNNDFKIAPLNTSIKPLLEGDPNQVLINSGLSSIETENVIFLSEAGRSSTSANISVESLTINFLRC